MRRLILAALLLFSSDAAAKVINVEFKFTPFIGDPAKSDMHIEVARIRKTKCVEKAYEAGVRIKSAARLELVTTETPRSLSREATGTCSVRPIRRALRRSKATSCRCVPALRF